MYKFSHSTGGFYPAHLLKNYAAAGMLPDDLIDIDGDIHVQFTGQPPAGAMLGADAKGFPAWVDIPVPTLIQDELAAKARHYRNAFIIATDPMMVSDYSIDDVPLTEAQRSELTIIRAAYRAWPTVTGWPLVELPELPQWLLIEAVNQGYRVPVWPELPDVA